MNVVQPLRGVLADENRPELQALPLGRGRWSVLFAHEDRPLLLPAADHRLQARCMRYFLPAGRKAVQAHLILGANAALPGLNLLPEVRIESGPRGFLSGQIPLGRPAYTAVQIGTPGPYRKATAVLVSAGGEGYVHAKIAMVPGADRQIGEEAGWLRELERARELENQVPRLFLEDSASNGRRYLVTTLAPVHASTRQFTAAHVAFLSALGRVRREVMSFATSACCESLEKTLKSVAVHLMPAERSTLAMALSDCKALLDGWMGPFVLGHGDFAPWNIRLRGDRLFVYDWEHARAGANPLADAFNFRVMQRAVLSSGLGPRFLAASLRHLQKTADLLYPEFTWRSRAVSGLALAYLLEAILQSAFASRTLARTHPVVASYLRLVEERAEWLAT